MLQVPPAMSRTLTSTEIIEKGDYLEPSFNPTSLTVSQLLGVLSFHEIKYPQPYTKGKLVQTFNDVLKPQTAKLMQERLSREYSHPSNEGILDGKTGKRLRVDRSVRLLELRLHLSSPHLRAALRLRSTKRRAYQLLVQGGSAGRSTRKTITRSTAHGWIRTYLILHLLLGPRGRYTRVKCKRKLQRRRTRTQWKSIKRSCTTRIWIWR